MTTRSACSPCGLRARACRPTSRSCRPGVRCGSLDLLGGRRRRRDRRRGAGALGRRGAGNDRAGRRRPRRPARGAPRLAVLARARPGRGGRPGRRDGPAAPRGVPRRGGRATSRRAAALARGAPRRCPPSSTRSCARSPPGRGAAREPRGAPDRGPRRGPGRGVPAVRLAPGRAPRHPRARAQRERRGRDPRGGLGRALDAFATALATEAPPLARVDDGALGADRPRGPGRVRGGRLGRRRRRAAGLPRRRDVRRLPRGALRSRRPPLPLPVHQLHRLRAAVHDHRVAPVRPRAHVDARVPDVRGLPARVRGSRPTGASTPSPWRAPRAGRGCRSSTPRRRRRSDRDRGGVPARRRDRGDQGPRRVPPRVRRHRRGRGRPAARAQAPARQAVRGDGAAMPRQARAWFAPTAAELEALASWRAPIVLVRRPRALAPSVAPGFTAPGRDAPLDAAASPAPACGRSAAGDDERQRERRADLHRERRGARAARPRSPTSSWCTTATIVARYDDSVVRVRTGAERRACCGGRGRSRRARSSSPRRSSPTLGTGALLHGAFCLAAGTRAFLSQHVGDLDTEESMARLPRGARPRSARSSGSSPRSWPTTCTRTSRPRGSPRSSGCRRSPCSTTTRTSPPTMAEHGLTGAVLGLAFDGLGLGDDGTIWGGELLVCDAAAYRRVGHLRRVRSPAATRPRASRCGWRSRTPTTPACWTTRSPPGRDARRSSTWSAVRSSRGLGVAPHQLRRPSVRRGRGARRASAHGELTRASRRCCSSRSPSADRRAAADVALVTQAVPTACWSSTPGR